MPHRLHDLLSASPVVTHSIPNLIHLLGRICDANSSIASARLCHAGQPFVGKLRHGLLGDGHNFCGYYNIQMLVGSLVATGAAGCEHFTAGIPSVLKLQELIEEAWDKGINSQGRTQTGGVKGTRKYIGTLEAQAVFKLLGVKTSARAFPEEGELGNASEQLIAWIKEYFGADEGVERKTSGQAGSTPGKVQITDKQPIYLQWPGHSVTAVGQITDHEGKSELLVFDPEVDMRKIVREVEDARPMHPSMRVLKAFRRGGSSLKRRRGFEILTVASL